MFIALMVYILIGCVIATEEMKSASDKIAQARYTTQDWLVFVAIVVAFFLTTITWPYVLYELFYEEK